jgi:hypothetical protein
VASYPGFYAVPGAMLPGALWPGNSAIPLPPGPPPAIFAIGTPYFQWATQEPYLG